MHQHLPTPLKLHGSRQARNLILTLRLYIGNNAILPRRDLLGQIHILRQRRLTLLDRALEVDVLDRVAEVGGLLDDGYEAVFDLEVDFGALGDVLGEGAGCCYGEGFASTCVCEFPGERVCGLVQIRLDLREWRIGIQIHALQLENIIFGVLAMLQWVLARDL